MRSGVCRAVAHCRHTQLLLWSCRTAERQRFSVSGNELHLVNFHNLGQILLAQDSDWAVVYWNPRKAHQKKQAMFSRFLVQEGGTPCVAGNFPECEYRTFAYTTLELRSGLKQC
jgi:hypothetical protein